MKKNKFNEELQQLSSEQLQDKVEALRKEYFNLKLSSRTEHVADYSRFKKLRNDIARLLTKIKEKSA